MALITFKQTIFERRIWKSGLLLLCGDVETNPGPFPSLPKLPSFNREDPITDLQDTVDDQEEKIRWIGGSKVNLFLHFSDLREMLEKQSEMIISIKVTINGNSKTVPG